MWIHVLLTRDLEDRQLARIGRRIRPRREIRGTDIYPASRKILTGHLRVVAGGAGALQRITEADGIDVGRIAQPELAEHEDIRAARDRGAIVIVALPRGEESEDGIVVVIAK